MVIRKLVMHNFGVYASTNLLEFKGDKPVVLIGGMNGRGKTTILEAILLSLYGANSFAYKESKYVTYSQYLKSYVNKSDGTLKTYVEIEFSMDSLKEEVYCVRREWDGKGLRVHEKIAVRKNGEDNVFLTENWPMFVENILPSALSSFFFFDGEKIAELAAEELSEQMKESIKAMLGITILDILQSDLGKIISRISKKNVENGDLRKLEELRSIKEEAKNNLNNIDIAIENVQRMISALELELEQLNINYSVKGGGILEQKSYLMEQRSQSKAAMDSSQEQLLDQVSGELPLLLVKGLLLDIEKEGKLEYERKLKAIALDKIINIYEKYPLKSEEVQEFVSFIEGEVLEEEQEETYCLSDINLYQVEKLNNCVLEQSKAKAKYLIDKRNQQQKKINDIDNTLSVGIDESILNDLFNQIKEKERQIIEKQVEINNLYKDRVVLNNTLMMSESEYTKFAEGTLAALESVDADQRTIKYTHMAIKIIKLYRTRLQERKTDILAQTMTKCYKKLATKKNLVDYIKMDSETLDLCYMNSEGEEIEKKRLSAGEKQLMVIALLWALAICSKKKLPVIIDTPLSRLDSLHRQALIKTYFPKASEQTIILSTDSEIDKNYYLLMKKSIGDEYTLIYDDKSKNTTIKPGYFEWGGSKT